MDGGNGKGKIGTSEEEKLFIRCAVSEFGEKVRVINLRDADVRVRRMFLVRNLFQFCWRIRFDFEFVLHSDVLLLIFFGDMVQL